MLKSFIRAEASRQKSGRGSMKEHSAESLKIVAFDPQPLNIPAKPQVRTLGLKALRAGVFSRSP